MQRKSAPQVSSFLSELSIRTSSTQFGWNCFHFKLPISRIYGRLGNGSILLLFKSVCCIIIGSMTSRNHYTQQQRSQTCHHQRKWQWSSSSKVDLPLGAISPNDISRCLMGWSQHKNQRLILISNFRQSPCAFVRQRSIWAFFTPNVQILVISKSSVMLHVTLDLSFVIREVLALKANRL